MSKNKATTFAAVWALYADWCGKFMAREDWQKGAGAHQRALLGFFGGLPLGKLDHAQLDAYRAHRLGAVAASSRNREVSTVIRFTKWAAKRRFIQEPLTAPDWEKETPRPRAYITADVLGRWLAEVRAPEARQALVFAWWTGLRWGEIAALTWAMVEWSEDGQPRAVVLPEAITKTSTGRVVPLPGEAPTVILARRSNGTPDAHVFGLKYHTLAYQLAQARKRAGITPDHVFHSSRHTAATNLERAGVGFPTVKAIIGHKSDRVALGYQHASREQLQEASKRVTERFLKNPSEAEAES